MMLPLNTFMSACGVGVVTPDVALASIISLQFGTKVNARVSFTFLYSDFQTSGHLTSYTIV